MAHAGEGEATGLKYQEHHGLNSENQTDPNSRTNSEENKTIPSGSTEKDDEDSANKSFGIYRTAQDSEQNQACSRYRHHHGLNNGKQTKPRLRPNSARKYKHQYDLSENRCGDSANETSLKQRLQYKPIRCFQKTTDKQCTETHRPELDVIKTTLATLADDKHKRNDLILSLQSTIYQLEQNPLRNRKNTENQIDESALLAMKEKYKDEIYELHHANGRLQTVLRTLSEDNDKLRNNFEDEHARLNISMANFEKQQKSLKTTEIELENCKKRLREISEDDVHKNDVIKELRTKVAAVEQTFQQTSQNDKETMKALESEKSNLVSDYNAEISELKQKTTVLRKRIDYLSKENDTLKDISKQNDKRSSNEMDLLQKRLQITEMELMDTKTKPQKEDRNLKEQYDTINSTLQVEKHELEACNTHLRSEIGRMKQDIVILKNRHESDCNALQKEMHRKEKELEETGQELDNLNKIYSEKEVNTDREIDGLRSQLADAMIELQQMKKEARETMHAAKNDTIDADTKYRNELSILRLSKIDFERQVENLLKENEKLKTDIDRQRQAYEIKSIETATKLAYMERSGQKFKDELDETRTRYSEDELNMHNEIAGLQSKLADAKATLLQMKKESSETMHAAKNKNIEADTKYRNELSRLQQSKLDLERFIETLLKENEKLKIDMDKQDQAYETKLIENTSKLKNMERSGQKLKDELDGTRTRLLEISEGEKNKGEQIVEMRTRLFDVEKTFQQTSKNYKEQIKALENENSKIASESSNEVSKLKQKTSDLRKHVEELTKEHDTLRDLSKQSEKQSSDKIETLRKRVQSTHMELTNTITNEEHSSQALSESKIASLQREKHKLEDSKAYLDNKNDQLKKNINKLKNRLDSDNGDLQNQLHRKENELKEIELELENASTRFAKEEVNMKNEIEDLRANLVEVQATPQQTKRDAEERILAFENKKSDTDAQYNAERTRFQQNKIRSEKHVDQLLRENEKCKTDIDRQTQTFENMLTETKSRMRKICEDNARKNSEIDKLQTSLANVEQKFQQTRKEAKGNTKQIESERSNLVSEHNKEVSRLQHNINDMKRHIEDLSTENDELKSYNRQHEKQSSNDIDTLKQRLQSTEMDLLDVRKKLQKEKEKNKSQVMYETTITNLKVEKRKLEVCKEDLETKNGQMMRDIINLENRLGSNQKSARYSDSDYDALQKQLRRREKELKDTEHELEDTKTRLVKCVHYEEVNSNPNIADLSDIHRPTRLADRFHELYDDRWTDAFETLEEFNICKKDIIRILLTIVTQTKQFCDGQSEQQMEDIKKAITQSDEVRQQGIPDNVMKYIKDFRKDSFAEIRDNVYKKYQRWLQSDAVAIPKYVVELEDYTKECFELCWLIAIQDQRIVFSPEPKHDDTFQSDVYKLYTVQGTMVDFLVWPALRLHENGPLLSKGVVQAQIPSGGEVCGKIKETT